jgi:succinoglycan biosynthesis transport protein ExoP
MSQVESLSHPLDVVRLAWKYPLRWAIPASVVAVAAFVFAALKPDSWEASQQMVVRNEAAHNQDGPGKFRHSDELKTLLETVLELSRSQVVLHAAMQQVDGAEPTEVAVSDLADQIKLSPPKGGEFGKSEVFYLKVKDKSRTRAVALATAICDQLERRFRELRTTRARSMVDEITRTEAMAQADVLAVTKQLQELEQTVGGDLSELRNLHQASSGSDSDLRRKSLEMENELRQATTEERRRHEWYKVLVEARSNPEQLLSLPSFTEVMPTLSKLKDSLLASQVQTAQLLGNMTAEHPHVRAAKASQAEISRHFEIELTSALRAAELDWRLAAERVERLKTAIPEMRGRLDRLASLRSEYSRRYNEVENRTKLMNEAQRELVDARAVQTSAEVASLITRVDTPLTGPRPQGPGKAVIMASGVAGGMIIGLGVLLLSLNTTSAPASIATQELRSTHNPPELVSEPTTPPARGYSLGDALRAVSQSFVAPSHHAS